ncbi:MAG: phosphogluconate dehydratase [Agarilytica sp.]
MTMHSKLVEITHKIIQRSHPTRQRYLARIKAAIDTKPLRTNLPCGNLAHGFAACSGNEKEDMTDTKKANIAIVSAYNDMLSAHQPYKDTPEQLKKIIQQAGGLSQFAGGVPAMCDGVTQGEPGMGLSLFSRDTIAMSTAIALSHNMFDGALYLGVCDKIVPGLLIGALSFGHLPAIFVPAGPMTSGLPNAEKSKARQAFAMGEIDRSELLKAESASYHSAGTCTFYGTANSNQMLMEIMGLHLPGSSFCNPDTPLRESLTNRAAEQILKFTAHGNDYRPVGKIIDEKAIVNGIIGLLATGGSTNHTIHLIAIANAAGIKITPQDFSDLSDIIPLMTRIYPNGEADINHFEAAGGMPFLMASLMDAGKLYGEVIGVADKPSLNLSYRHEAKLINNKLTWNDAAQTSADSNILRPANDPFLENGGLKTIQGTIGRGVIKVSAVKKEQQYIKAPAIVFHDQLELVDAFKAGRLNQDLIAVVKYQGPKMNGMPELHKLMTPLGALQDQGFKVALITDGRLSGASGKVPAAIHISPESSENTVFSKIRNGDMIELDVENGSINLLVDESEFNSRLPSAPDNNHHHFGMGRELFSMFRQCVSSAENGASCVKALGDES